MHDGWSTSRSPRFESLEARALLTVSMSPAEQLMIELVNRARADPEAEAARYELDLNDEVGEDDLISADPKQPLAPHQALTDAAGLHSEDMLNRNFFGHNTPEGLSPSDRARAAGYSAGAGENIAWRGDSNLGTTEEVYERHQGLVESVGHRINMMRSNWREIGAGVRFGTFKQDFTLFPSIMVGTLFGNRGGRFFITGVAITDHLVRNQFYEVGEGIGDVTITAVNQQTDATFSDLTGASGGYGFQVPNGVYTVTATGGSLPEPIVVSGVQVDGANVKVDFNRAAMPTRYIDGFVFEDSNANGSFDSTESGSPGRTVFLDYNDDGDLQANEPSMQSDDEGKYRFNDLLPRDYQVRLHTPDGITQSWPGDAYSITLTERHIIGADFGLHSDNFPPIARHDVGDVAQDGKTTIDVLQNDFDADGSLAIDSIQVTTPPAHGDVTVLSSGEVSYTPAPGFAGQDAFEYTVRDLEGTVSLPAVVDLTIISAKAWHNAAAPLDVNNDGFVVSQDALIVIREINRGGLGTLSERSRPENSGYFDVNGDDFLSALDPLRIIRFLNAQSGAGEPPTVPTVEAAATDAYFAAAVEFSKDDEEGVPERGLV